MRHPTEIESAIKCLRANIETCAMNGDNGSIYQCILHTLYWATGHKPEPSIWDGETPLVVRRMLGEEPMVPWMPEWKRKVCEQILSQPLDDGSYVDHC